MRSATHYSRRTLNEDRCLAPEGTKSSLVPPAFAFQKLNYPSILNIFNCQEKTNAVLILTFSIFDNIHQLARENSKNCNWKIFERKTKAYEFGHGIMRISKGKFEFTISCLPT